MANDFNLLEFAGISDERPWELSPPSKTDLRVVVSGEQIPSIEVIGKAIASFVGDSIEAEEVEPPDQDIHWAMRARINGLTNDILVWAEPLNAFRRQGGSNGNSSCCWRCSAVSASAASCSIPSRPAGPS